MAAGGVLVVAFACVGGVLWTRWAGVARRLERVLVVARWGAAGANCRAFLRARMARHRYTPSLLVSVGPCQSLCPCRFSRQNGAPPLHSVLVGLCRSLSVSVSLSIPAVPVFCIVFSIRLPIKWFPFYFAILSNFPQRESTFLTVS